MEAAQTATGLNCARNRNHREKNHRQDKTEGRSEHGLPGEDVSHAGRVGCCDETSKSHDECNMGRVTTGERRRPIAAKIMKKQPTCRTCGEPIDWLWDHGNQRWVAANPGIVRHTGSDEWVLLSCGFSHLGKPAMFWSKTATKGEPVRVPHRCKNREPKKPLREFRNEEYSLF